MIRFISIKKQYKITSMYPLNPFVLIDKDAIAFLKAANIDITKQYFPGTQYEINGGVIWGAVDTLVKGLKANNLWNKHKILYPLIGDTLASKSVNLISPSTYNLQYYNSIGNYPNGISALTSTSYADTGFNSQNLDINSHICVYSQTAGANGGGGQGEFGCVLNSISAIAIGVYRIDSSVSFSEMWNDSSAAKIIPSNNALGFYLGNRQSSSILQHWENGIKIANGGINSGTKPDLTLKLFLIHSRSGAIVNRIISHASAGNALTDAEVVIKTQLIKQFETTLKRNVI